MKIIIADNYEEMSIKAANIVAEQIKLKPSSSLGLATGGTPVGMYQSLIKMYENGEISFKDITTYNLDEYIGLPENHEQSYRYFMDNNLFNHIDIDKSKTNVPNGNINEGQADAEAKRYDKLISNAEIDLQVLGIGGNGHIGFNEPCDIFNKNVFAVKLTENTIKANSRFFNDISEVPKMAITMGIKSIMMAKKIILLASGKEKSEIIKATIQGNITPKVPASVLQLHRNVTFVLDKEAAALL